MKEKQQKWSLFSDPSCSLFSSLWAVSSQRLSHPCAAIYFYLSLLLIVSAAHTLQPTPILYFFMLAASTNERKERFYNKHVHAETEEAPEMLNVFLQRLCCVGTHLDSN